ncbi:MAG: leucine-rich repeat protein [Clostridiales Family XIII bacterium]|nr:leucine-rich repeat protein [Clostridiales Family XIII bacterium]
MPLENSGEQTPDDDTANVEPEVADSSIEVLGDEIEPLAVYSGTIENAEGDADAIAWSYDDVTGTLSLSGTGTIPYNTSPKFPWFDYKDTIVAVMIGESIIGIADISLAFWSYRSIERISFPSTFTYIGKAAFESCVKLENINLSETLVEEIGESAFSACESLSHVEFPTSLKFIGGDAFGGSGLIKVDLSASQLESLVGGFNGCNELKSIILPSTITGAMSVSGRSLINGNPLLTDIFFNNSVPPSFTTSGKGSGFFEDDLIDRVYTIHVPVGSGDAYSNAFETGNFPLGNFVFTYGVPMTGSVSIDIQDAKEKFDIGDILTANTSSVDYDDTNEYTYKWFRDGEEISGETGKTYTTTSSDEGKNITVRVYVYPAKYYTEGLLASLAVTNMSKYTLTVNGGTGSGEYEEGTTVKIKANAAPSGKVFDKWVAYSKSRINLADENSRITTLVMPADDVEIEATYVSTSSKQKYHVIRHFGEFGGSGDVYAELEREGVIRARSVDEDFGDNISALSGEPVPNFKGLYYNGNKIAASNYDVSKDGETITITMNEAHARSYLGGAHEFIAEFADGTSDPIQLSVIDTDGDGAPDWWEIENGYNPNDPTDFDPNGDDDGDGISNIDEFRNGTNPKVADANGLPKTGDDSNMMMWLYLGAGSLSILIFLLYRRRNEELV